MKTFNVCLLGHSYIRDLKSLDIHEIVIDSSYRIQFNYIFKPGANIPYFLKNENLESLYSCAPDVVFLFLGGNDIRLDFDIHETISQYKLLVQIIACNLPKTDIICSYIEPRFAAANRRFKTPDPGEYTKLAKKKKKKKKKSIIGCKGGMYPKGYFSHGEVTDLKTLNYLSQT